MMNRTRLLIVDDGPAGALEHLIGHAFPDALALVSSPRPRPAGVTRSALITQCPSHMDDELHLASKRSALASTSHESPRLSAMGS